jgi:hypothetical protein
VELKVRESVNTRVDNLKTTIEEVISTHSVGNLWERSLFTVSIKQVSDTDVTKTSFKICALMRNFVLILNQRHWIDSGANFFRHILF